MKRPPDRKFLVVAALLVAAAAAALARPALGTSHAADAVVLVKLFGRS